jgi:hypothetical protein
VILRIDGGIILCVKNLLSPHVVLDFSNRLMVRRKSQVSWIVYNVLSQKLLMRVVSFVYHFIFFYFKFWGFREVVIVSVES